MQSFRQVEKGTRYATGNIRLRRESEKGSQVFPLTRLTWVSREEVLFKILAYDCNNALQILSNSHKGTRCYYYLILYFLLADKTLGSLAL